MIGINPQWLRWSPLIDLTDGNKRRHTMRPASPAPHGQSSCKKTMSTKHVIYCCLSLSLLTVMRPHAWSCGLFIWPHCWPWSKIPSISIYPCSKCKGGEAQVDEVGDVGELMSRESCSVCHLNLPQILYGIEPHCTGSSLDLRGQHAWGALQTHTAKTINCMELTWITGPWKWFAKLLGAMLSMFLDSWVSLKLKGPLSQLGECLQILPCFI